MGTEQGTIESCKCDSCQRACSHKPGFFAYGEVEKVAEYLKIPLLQLFQTKLMIDWWDGTTETFFILSPAVEGAAPGEEFGEIPEGKCVFFENGLCSIHEVKPLECRKLFHPYIRAIHQEAAMTWDNKDAQKQIRKLLKREPIAVDTPLHYLIGRL